MTTDSTAIPEGYKKCRVCGEIKPANREYFYKDKTKDGWCHKCIPCFKEMNRTNRLYRKEHPIKRAPEGYKICTVCGETKPATNEYFSLHPKSGLHPTCKVCRAADARRYRAEHPDYRKNVRRNPESDAISLQWREAHRQELRDYTRQWRQENRGKFNLQKIRRRTRQLNLPFSFSIEDERRALEYWHGYCAVCGEPLRDLFGEHQAHLDHWIPLSDSRPDNPGTVPTNMLPLCSSCNLSKNNSDPLKWLQDRFGGKSAARILKRIKTYFEWAREQSPK